ncbi:MAG TPA: class I SAM-dependent methyltransferase [Gemmatimonadaceae bacterium]|nr:class I SAM-dependent methyltransferase [Gemmatimonadaceae bacterium]
MFSASAELYDLIYSGFKDYPAEAAQLATIIRRLHPAARTVLDVACGTGEHARLLAEEHGFEVDGLDLDAAFVEIARRKLQRGSVHHGDMTSFALPRRYDVILCLFSSIGYVRTLEKVRRTLERFREHLAGGGIVLVEPWFAPGVLEPGRVSIDTARSERVSVVRMAHTEVEGRLSRIRFEYLIGRPEGIEHAAELHELGLFTTEEMLDCFREAGLEAAHDPEGPSGRGLFIARASLRAPPRSPY